MNTLLDSIYATTKETLHTTSDKFIAVLPELAGAIAVLVIGWLVASALYHICVRVFGFIAMDKLVAKTPLHNMLREIGVHKPLSEIISLLIFWLTVLVTLIVASEILKLEQLSRVLAQITGYVPNVIAAVVIIILGMLLAKILRMMVTQAVSRIDMGYEQSIGKAVYALVLLIVFLVAFNQLGFDMLFISTNVLILVTIVLITIGVALVVSSRTILENKIAAHQLQKSLKPGATIQLGEISGKIVEIKSSGVLIEGNGKRTVVPALFFLKQSYTVS